MDYEKAYKAVLKTATQWIKDGCTDKERICLECVFTELRESEDERIRKELVEYHKQQFENNRDQEIGLFHKDALAYLDRQKEQKEIPLMGGDTDTYFDDLRMTTKPLTSREWFEEGIKYAQRVQKEQKPAEWSEEDEEMLNSCISSIEEAKENRYAYKETDGDTSYDHEIAWLKSLRPQSIQNKFDEAMHVADKFEEGYKAGVYDTKAKSWKPSEEQMEALQRAIDACESEWDYQDDELRSLLNDLKKL